MLQENLNSRWNETLIMGYGLKFRLPSEWETSGFDNVVSLAQTVNLDEPTLLREFHLLYAGDWIDGERTADGLAHDFNCAQL